MYGNGTKGRLLHCDVSGNGRAGILIAESAEPTLVSNIVHATRGVGVLVTNARVLLKGSNTFFDNRKDLETNNGGLVINSIGEEVTDGAPNAVAVAALSPDWAASVELEPSSGLRDSVIQSAGIMAGSINVAADCAPVDALVV